MSAKPFDAVDLLTKAVQDVADDLPDLIVGSTAPDLGDLAAPYAALSDTLGRLRGLVDDLGDAIAREMTGDQVEGERYRITRRRSADRKAWDHESLRRDFVRHVLRDAGALGGQVVSADGELLAATVGGLMSEALGLYGAVAPKVGAMRDRGLDPQEYCETSKGRTHVTVTRLADETEAGAA